MKNLAAKPRVEVERGCIGSPPASRRKLAGEYIWLAYSAFFFINPLLNHDTRYWIECIAIYMVFLAIYVTYVHVRSRRVRYYLLAAFFVLGAVTFPFNTGATSFMIYSAAFLPFAVERIWLARGILVLECCAVGLERLVVHGRSNAINLALAVFGIAIIGAANSFIAEQKRADSRLRLANDEIEQLAALAERERIARDLHDVLGHTLSLIVLKTELATRLLRAGADPALAVREMNDVEQTARKALAEVREAIGGYRAQGLAAELDLARSTLGAAGVALSCETPIPRLAPAEETVLCLALREAVTNIIRHAAASSCRVHFSTSDQGFRTIRVEDDGVGLSAAPGTVNGGNGLRGMRERVEGMGGSFLVSAGTHGRGTVVQAGLPPAGAGLLQVEAAGLVQV